jgi:peptide deformylase
MSSENALLRDNPVMATDTGQDTEQLSRRQQRERDRDEARRLVALSQIRRYPDPVLRERARAVEGYSDDLAALGERMAGIMEDAHGVGLAATQIGLVRRVLVMRPDDEADPVVLVNAEITSIGDERETADEGCLSLPGVSVPVERALSVVVEARDVTGAPIRLELSGIGARVAQHEIDHLDGVLMLDRTTPEARREAMAELRPPPGSRTRA